LARERLKGDRRRALRWLADQAWRPRPLLGISLNILAPAKIRLDGKACRNAPHAAKQKWRGWAGWPQLASYPARRGSPCHGLSPRTALNALQATCLMPHPLRPTRRGGCRPLSTLLTNRSRLPRGRRLFRITGLPHWTRNKHAART